MLQPRKHIGSFDRPVLVFGGPYSNYQATTALLKEADSLSIPASHIICTGDIVAYAGQPEATSQLIKDSGIQVVMGNCEESLATDSMDCGCGFSKDMQCSLMSIGWYNHAKQQVSAANKQWMGTLPRTLTFRINGIDCHVVHGGISQINEFIFASTAKTTKVKQWQQTQSDIVIGGHCGMPFADQLMALNNNKSIYGLWLNAGVIGLPANDGTPDGWYMLLTPEAGGVRISWQRLTYDYRTCQQHMLAANLGDYTDTMHNGLWPSMDVLPKSERLQQGKPLRIDDIYFYHS